MIIKQVDFVYIQKTPMGPGQKSRLEPFLPSGEGTLQIQGPRDPILCRPQGEVDNGCMNFMAFRLNPVAARFTQAGYSPRLTIEPAPFHGLKRRKKTGKSPYRRRFSGPAIPKGKDAADGRIDRRHDQRIFQGFLADNRGERENSHRHPIKNFS